MKKQDSKRLVIELALLPIIITFLCLFIGETINMLIILGIISCLVCFTSIVLLIIRSNAKIKYVAIAINLILFIFTLLFIINAPRRCIGCNTPPRDSIYCPECINCKEEVCECQYEDENGNIQTITCPDNNGEE